MTKPFGIIEPCDLEFYKKILPQINWSYAKNYKQLIAKEIPAAQSNLVFLPVSAHEAILLNQKYDLPDLTHLFNKNTLANLSFNTRSSLSVDGKLIAVPREENLIVFAYRPDRLAYFGCKVPNCLNELLDYSLYIHKKSKQYSLDFLSGTSLNLKCFISNLYYSFDTNTKKTEDLNESSIRELYNWLYTLGVKNKCFPIDRILIPSALDDHFSKEGQVNIPFRFHWIKYLCVFPKTWQEEALLAPVPSTRGRPVIVKKGSCFIGPKNCNFQDKQTDVIEMNFGENFSRVINSLESGVSSYTNLKAESVLLKRQTGWFKDGILDDVRFDGLWDFELSKKFDRLIDSLVTSLSLKMSVDDFLEDYYYGAVVKKQFFLPSKLKESIQYVDSHYSKIGTVEEISKRVGMSESKLNKLFKKYLDQSCNEYLLVKKMESALYSIQSTEKSIEEISIELSFLSVEEFSTAYKNYYGLAPSRF